jgi:D-alanine-D-alanine ligase
MGANHLQGYFYWVLAPSIVTTEENIDYYYDFSQSIEEYKVVFENLNLPWKWLLATINNYKTIIKEIADSKNGLTPFVINLCDGDDVNDVPGVSVIHELEKYGLLYSGSNAYFYDITTSKIPMKKAFDIHKVANAKWTIINENCSNIFTVLNPPILIKPAVSGGSMGVSIKNVVHNIEDLEKRVEELKKGYKGWSLMADGLFAEEFIIGQEFTTFIIGSHSNLNNCVVYEPIHRAFHNSLAKEEQFLSFDRLWEIYEEETAMPNEENFYEYKKVEDVNIIKQLKQLTLDAYKACKGEGYARLDFRIDDATGKLYCLEINAQCGLSEDENFTSIGAILKVSNESFTNVIKKIIMETINKATVLHEAPFHHPLQTFQ